MTNTDHVRAACKRLGRFTRVDLLAALPEMTKKDIGRAFDGLAKGEAKVVPGVEVPTVLACDGRTVQAKVYEYVGKDYKQAPKPEYTATSVARKVQPKATKALHSKATVQRKSSGYAPGHFTQDMRLHDWPPGFTSRIAPGPALPSSLSVIARRESDAATGKGYGAGTVVMTGTPTNPRPKMMVRAA